ncbi:Uncharacterised protein [Zhongshania aliphaticivorans]|uniref:DSBA-like thioredoxin domain-containing protein n=1 Tax=Zhongshania aliphaticivorans TaxID=1470434 RepID=A0A5S9MU50_9GAMM|nr:DsbA family protein [Zhongshania aliphaticivorans]CAA0080518.1 Uncharacterised protein [Zhongshania aliphaticivorans]CAA0085630.1 Uncharacterised protein [Zhongshania aliphaticivorans]
MSRIKPYLYSLVSSQGLLKLQRAVAEWRRKQADKPHLVSVYLRINDPHSYLLLQVLPILAERYNIDFDFRTVLRLQEDMYPAPQLWEQHAFADSAFLANQHGLTFPKTPPTTTPALAKYATAQLLHAELQGDYLEQATEIFKHYWHDQEDALNTCIDPRIQRNMECYQHHLLANETRLHNNGHYLSAMLHYGEKPGGEWYWGLSRLAYLEQRLTALGAVKNVTTPSPSTELNTKPNAASNTGNNGESTPISDKIPIILYWSARSPYSYLGLVRAKALAARYDIPLIVKPVLPMVMRRMQVPRQKGLYIFKDTKREAEKYGIPFGFAADPLGAAVERCYALVDYASEQHCANLFLEIFTRSVWSEGIDAATDTGLKKIVEAAGLDWSHAKTLLNNNDWRHWAQENLLDMYDKGLWGVPSFHYRQLSVFGQDRLDRVECALREVYIAEQI